MKTYKTFKIMLMAFVLMLTLGVTGTTADAAKKKTNTYKTQTVKVMRGRDKDVKTSKKIKKVKICSKNKHFMVSLLYTKKRNKFEVQDTDYGKTQTVKVTYTNGWTQKFKIETVLSTYEKKILAELKPLLADPDKGLKKVIDEWMGDSKYFEPELQYTDFNDKIVSRMSLDEVIKNCSVSEKKALILERYFTKRMTYSTADNGSCSNELYLNSKMYKKLYTGTFKGVCQDGAVMANDICKLVGMKSVWISCDDINHAWCNVYVTNKNGTSYWKGIHATSFAYSLKKSIGISIGNENFADEYISKKQLKKNVCKNAQTGWHRVRKRKSKPTTVPTVTTPTPVQTPAATATPAPVTTPDHAIAPTVTPTPAPSAQRIVIPHDEHGYTCPGCKAPNRHTSKTNPYITNGTATDGDLIIYKHTTSEGVRWFDADGNEYIDINKNGFITDELDKLAE